MFGGQLPSDNTGDGCNVCGWLRNHQRDAARVSVVKLIQRSDYERQQYELGHCVES
jgi:hypothetical protein